MNLAETTDILTPESSYKTGLGPEISEIVKICHFAKNLMISVYHIEKDDFLHCNDHLKNFIGPNSNRLIEEGWRFWLSRIDRKESLWIRNKIFHFFELPHTPDSLFLRYHMTGSNAKRVCIKHEMHLHKIKGQTLALSYFFDVTDKELMGKYFKLSEAI